MKQVERRLDKFDKIALVISVILFIVNGVFMFNIISVHRGGSSLVLALSMIVLYYVIVKKQSKKLGYLYLICAILFLISGIMAFI